MLPREQANGKPEKSPFGRENWPATSRGLCSAIAPALVHRVARQQGSAVEPVRSRVPTRTMDKIADGARSLPLLRHPVRRRDKREDEFPSAHNARPCSFAWLGSASASFS